MGVKSTHIISRKLAIDILEDNICNMSDSQLSNCLEQFNVSEFRNYSVESEDESEDEIDKSETLIIKDRNQFFNK